MSGLLNVGSLILGIIAWIVPVLTMRSTVKNTVIRGYCLAIVSFSACTTSLCVQLFEINHRVQNQDWSALLDTTGTLIWVAAILVVVTFILNIIVLSQCKNSK